MMFGAWRCARVVRTRVHVQRCSLISGSVQNPASRSTAPTCLLKQPLLSGRLPACGFLTAIRLPVGAAAVQTRGYKSVKALKRIKVKLAPKKLKLKTKHAVAARFVRLGGGGLKYWHAGRRHNSGGRSSRFKRQSRRPGYAKGNLLKLLNKLLINR